MSETASETESIGAQSADTPEAPRRRRTTTRRKSAADAASQAERPADAAPEAPSQQQVVASEEAAEPALARPRATRARRTTRKSAASAQPQDEQASAGTQMELPIAMTPEAPAAPDGQAEAVEKKPATRRRRPGRPAASAEPQAAASDEAVPAPSAPAQEAPAQETPAPAGQASASAEAPAARRPGRPRGRRPRNAAVQDPEAALAQTAAEAAPTQAAQGAPEAGPAPETAPAPATSAEQAGLDGENPEAPAAPRRSRRRTRARDAVENGLVQSEESQAKNAARAEADGVMAEAKAGEAKLGDAEGPALAQDAPSQGTAANAGQADYQHQGSRRQHHHDDQRDQQGGKGRYDRPQRQGQRDRNAYSSDRNAYGSDRNGFNGDRNGFGNDRNAYAGSSQQGGKGRHQRRQQREQVMGPRTNREEIASLKVAELRAKAAELGLDVLGLKKAELVDAVYEGLVRQEGYFEFRGILDIVQEGFGFVRTKGYLPSENDVYCSQQVIRNSGLRRGDEITGVARAGRPGDKYAGLNKVTTVNGLSVEEVRRRPRFGDLTPVFPSERLLMEHGKDSILGRCIDIVSPIGKGQRGLIVSPPKAGKTTVLKSIAASIAANNPEVHLICLLVDERPEEVTDMRRSINGEVVASTFDMPSDNHIMVSELVIERAKRLVELGQDVVILLDSITRLARAYNLAQPASGRILSGGVDSTALYPPKRFLGAARNIENGGSLTILASALVETSSKMDEVIFEEFKGTGNMELRLDRDLADRRIFPAIDPVASGTRKEELLIEPNMAPFVWGLRRILAGMNNNERAMTQLIRGLKQTENNREFLIRCAKKAQMQELSI